MIENIKNEIYVQLELLFAEAATHEIANDMANYQKCLSKISSIATALGIKTEITKFIIDIKPKTEY